MEIGCLVCKFGAASLLSFVYQKLPTIDTKHNEATYILGTKTSQDSFLRPFGY